MTVDDKLILKLENLARLQLSEEERIELKKDLTEMLGMVDKLQELDTSHVEPLIYINENVHTSREDVVQSELSQKEALKNAPESKNGHFKVPQVIKKLNQ